MSVPEVFTWATICNASLSSVGFWVLIHPFSLFLPLFWTRGAAPERVVDSFPSGLYQGEGVMVGELVA